MTSDNYKWHQQTRFDGGIQVQPEVAKPDQVIDASNYWTPQSRCDRRPGICTQYGDLIGTSFIASSTAYSGTFTSVGNTASFSMSLDPTTRLVLLTFAGHVFSAGIVKALVSVQVLTARGWVGMLTPTISSSITNNIGASPASIAFIPPTDTVTGLTVRVVITGAITNTNTFLSAGTVFSTPPVGGGGGTQIATYGPDTIYTGALVFNNAIKAQYASGTWTITADIRGQTSNNFLNLHSMTNFNGAITPFTLAVNLGQVGPNFNPASVSVVPEFNTAYIALANRVYEFPYNQTPTIAQVNSDPLIVGPTDIAAATTSIYPSDQIPQLPNFPSANLIVYFRDRLWAAGLQGQPATIRWGAAASTGNGPAYNVWPSASFVQLSTAQDNSPITAIAALADNLVVFKKNSIWLMIDRGTDANGLALFEPRLVVAGVGCLAHNSVRAIFGKGLVFLAEDGFYLFDGTPNVKCLSDPIKTFVTQISPARAPFAQAVNWRRQQVYLCAVSLNGEMNSNNFVFCYDYQADAWWVWQGWDVQCWYQDDGVGLKEEIWFFDRYGRASKLEGGDTDNGTPISSYLTTHRFGEFDIVSTAIDEVRLQSSNQADVLAPVTVGVITEDIQTIEGKDKSVAIPLDGETLWADPPVSGVSTWVPDRRRERKKTFKVTGKWVQMTVKNALQVIMLACGYLPDSRR